MATLSDAGRNAAVNAVTAQLNSGKVIYHTSGHGVIATLTFSSTAFGAASSGSASANAIAQDANAAGGTISHCHFCTSGNTEVLTMTCGVGSGEVQVSNLTVAAGEKVSMSSATISQAAS